MTTQTLTVQLPGRFYSRLEQRASQSNRSLEAELIEVLATAIPVDTDLPADIAKESCSGFFAVERGFASWNTPQSVGTR